MLPSVWCGRGRVPLRARSIYPQGVYKQGNRELPGHRGRCNYNPDFTELRASLGSLSRDELVALLGSD